MSLSQQTTLATEGQEKKDRTAGYEGGLARSLVRTLLIYTFIPLIIMAGAAYLRSRTLLRVTIEDTARTEAAIQTLMGKDVQPRFAFIMNRAPKVEEVDV